MNRGALRSSACSCTCGAHVTACGPVGARGRLVELSDASHEVGPHSGHAAAVLRREAEALRPLHTDMQQGQSIAPRGWSTHRADRLVDVDDVCMLVPAVGVVEQAQRVVRVDLVGPILCEEAGQGAGPRTALEPYKHRSFT